MLSYLDVARCRFIKIKIKKIIKKKLTRTRKRSSAKFGRSCVNFFKLGLDFLSRVSSSPKERKKTVVLAGLDCSVTHSKSSDGDRYLCLFKLEPDIVCAPTSLVH